MSSAIVRRLNGVILRCADKGAPSDPLLVRLHEEEFAVHVESTQAAAARQ